MRLSRIVKWLGGVLGLLIFVFIGLHAYGIATGQSDRLVEYQEWKYDRLKDKLDKAQNEKGRYQGSVLAACSDYFPGSIGRANAYHCYQSAFKDQKRKWIYFTFVDSKIPAAPAIWSKNVIFDEDRIYAVEMMLVCKEGEVRTIWNLDDDLPSDTMSVKMRLSDAAIIDYDLEPTDYAKEIVLERVRNEKFLVYIEDGRGALRLWVPRLNGKDHEFRFDISKLPRELKKLKKACGIE